MLKHLHLHWKYWKKKMSIQVYLTKTQASMYQWYAFIFTVYKRSTDIQAIKVLRTITSFLLERYHINEIHAHYNTNYSFRGQRKKYRLSYLDAMVAMRHM